jgi:hypothetical protein
VLWEIDKRAWLFIEPNAARAVAGRITLSVTGLDGLLERLAARIEHEPIETYPNRKLARGFVTKRPIYGRNVSNPLHGAQPAARRTTCG